LKNRTASAKLNSRLGIECITDVVRRSSLRWFSLAERKDRDDWVSTFRHFEVEGVRNRGRSRKAIDERVKKVKLGLYRELTLYRVSWRGLVCRNRPFMQA